MGEIACEDDGLLGPCMVGFGAAWYVCVIKITVKYQPYIRALRFLRVFNSNLFLFSQDLNPRPS